MTAVSRLALLAFALLLAQFALVGHGVEHAFHDHDEPCVECLVLPGMQAVPKQAPRLQLPRTASISGDSAVPPAPTLAHWLAFRGRAPPRLPC